MLDAALIPAASGAGTSATLRAKRYVREIGQLIQGVVTASAENAKLAAAEEELSADVLLRKLYAAEHHKNALAERLKQLEGLQPLQTEVVELKDQVELLSREKDELQQQRSQLQEKLEQSSKSGKERYEELYTLFNRLSTSMSEQLEKDANQKLLVANLQSEVLLWRSKCETLENGLRKSKESLATLQAEQNTRAAKLVEAAERSAGEALQARTELGRLEQTMQTERQQAEGLVSQLRNQLETLNSENAKLQRIVLQGQRQPKVGTETEPQPTHREAELEERNRHLQQQLEDLLTTLRVSKDQDATLQQAQTESQRWQQAAQAVEESLCAGVPVTPSLLSRYLTECNTLRRQQERVTSDLACELQQVTAQLAQASDAVHQLELKTAQHETRRTAAEAAEAVMRGHVEILLEIAKQARGSAALELQSSTAGGADDADGGTLSSDDRDGGALTTSRTTIDDLLSKAEMLKSHFDDGCARIASRVDQLEQLQSNLREDLLASKVHLQEQYGRSQAMLSRAENLLQSKTREAAELEHRLQEQKDFISKLQSQLRDLTASVKFADVTALKRDVLCATRLMGVTKDFFLNEAKLLRSLVKAILGWSLCIEKSEAEWAISLVPAFEQDDESGEIVFVTTPNEAKVAAESFADSDFQIHLTGTFADSWEAGENWKNALLVRQHIPAFLAATFLDVFGKRGETRLNASRKKNSAV